MNIESISYLLRISACCRRLRVVFAEVERVDEKELSVVAGGVDFVKFWAPPPPVRSA